MTKKKGAYYEYKLMNILENYNYATIRTLGSGAGTKKPKPDVIASNGINTYAMEIKHRNKDVLYIEKLKINNLKKFSKTFGAVPLIVVQFYKSPFFVFSLESVKSVGKYYKINYSSIHCKNCCTELTEFLENN